MSAGSKEDTIILGAGPYGLSIAAHLTEGGVPHRIFGVPMESWRRRMPQGMFLKSDGFASDLSAPGPGFRLKHFCAETGRPYHDTARPVPIQTFLDYGMEFQRRKVPELEQTLIASILRNVDGSFTVTSAAGETMRARRVVVAAGISHLAFLPAELATLPRELCSHTADHNDMGAFRGKQVAVLGAGASAVDCAALLHEAGAQTELIARATWIRYNVHSDDEPSLWQRLRYPPTGLGNGWKSKLCVDMPLVFHAMPRKFRARVVQRHLGPAPGWFVRAKVEGKVKQHLGCEIQRAEPRNGRLCLTLRAQDGSTRELTVDHLMAGTGYKPLLERLTFLDEGLRRQVKTVDGQPVLDRNFQSSVRGLYLVGLMAAPSFGPLLRFAYGTDFTARHLAKHLTR
jgi:thioredoxin reductase